MAAVVPAKHRLASYLLGASLLTTAVAVLGGSLLGPVSTGIAPLLFLGALFFQLQNVTAEDSSFIVKIGLGSWVYWALLMVITVISAALVGHGIDGHWILSSAGWMLVLSVLLGVAHLVGRRLRVSPMKPLLSFLIATGLLSGYFFSRDNEYWSYSDGQFLLPTFGFWPGFHEAVTSEIEVEIVAGSN